MHPLLMRGRDYSKAAQGRLAGEMAKAQGRSMIEGAAKAGQGRQRIMPRTIAGEHQGRGSSLDFV